MSLEQLLFLVVAAVIVLAALGAVFARRIMHAALCAVVVFTAVGGIYAIIGSYFIAVAQVLIYIGAVATVLVFAVMLSGQKDIAGGSPIRRQARWKTVLTWAAFVVGLVMVFQFTLNLTVPASGPANAPVAAESATGLRSLGQLLFYDYLLPFEVISLLLLLVLIGAVVIARKESDPQ